MITALTLLPALLSACGRRLVPRPGSRAALRAAHDHRATMGTRWVTRVLRHPLRNLLIVAVALLAVAAPATQLKTALTDDGSNAASTSTRQAYDLVADAFGPGANGPLVLLVENDSAAATGRTAEAVAGQLRDVPGVADVSGVDTAPDGTAARLQQVLRNLVGNAVKHTAVTVSVTTAPGMVELRVVDNGPGISPQDLPRVFERFWRAEASRSRAYGGSGLGLAIVEAIVHAHDGQVSVVSALGEGTTVTVRLPVRP